jgi:dipeptidyl aminopeptidase/acylaminoacyl peptidase
MKTSFLSLLVVLVGAHAVGAQELTYWQDVRPIFRKHCTVCHSAKHLKEADVSGGLALDTLEAVRKGSTRPVIAGKSDASVLIKLLESTDVNKRMPLDANPLPKETIALIRSWIDTGAKEGRPAEDTPEPKIAAKSSVRRKLDVVMSTTAVPPAGLLGKKVPAKLDLALKVGPLPPVAAVAFSPDNKLLASGTYGQVAVWDLVAARPVKVLTNVLGAVNDLKFSPDGKVLAVAGGQPSAKGDLRLYQVADWKLLGVLRDHDDVVFSVAFSSDGKRLASASFDHTVRLWNVADRQMLRSYASHSDFVYAVAFSPDGKYLASAGKDRVVKLVETETGKSVFTFSGMDQDVMALAYSPDAKNIVSSGFETGIYWWNPQTGERTKLQGGHGVAVHELAFSKDGKRLVSAGADRTVRIWDGAAGTALKVLPVGSIAYAVAISPSNKLVASGTFDGLTRLWDEATGRHLVTLLAFPGEGDHAEWLALTPEGYAAGSDKTLAASEWRMAGGSVVGRPIWTALRRPEMVSRAIGGEKPVAPKFEVKN